MSLISLLSFGVKQKTRNIHEDKILAQVKQAGDFSLDTNGPNSYSLI